MSVLLFMPRAREARTLRRLETLFPSGNWVSASSSSSESESPAASTLPELDSGALSSDSPGTPPSLPVVPKRKRTKRGDWWLVCSWRENRGPFKRRADADALLSRYKRLLRHAGWSLAWATDEGCSVMSPPRFDPLTDDLSARRALEVVQRPAQ